MTNTEIESIFGAWCREFEEKLSPAALVLPIPDRTEMLNAFLIQKAHERAGADQEFKDGLIRYGLWRVIDDGLGKGKAAEGLAT
jgi:hypothetical protein